MGGISFLVYRGAAYILPGISKWLLAVHLATAILAGMAALLPILSVLKVDDLNGVAGLIRRRLTGGEK